jgi:predicted transcriptional regulator
VSHHKIQVPDVPNLINAVATELGSLGTEATPTAMGRPEPAVNVRRSVRPDHLVCLICGKKQKLLKRHLAVEHELTPNQYHDSFGLKPEYPMAAPNYAQQRHQTAVKIGLGQPQRRRRMKGADAPRT